MTQEKNKKAETMKDLVGKIKTLPKSGNLIEGRILTITNTELIVDLGPLGTGIVYGAELKENKDMIRDLKIGDKISALIIETENDDGFVELSLKQANLEKTWNDLRQQKQTNETVIVRIIDANRGGLVVRLSGIVGFLPVSQLSSDNYPRVEGGDKNKILRHLSQFIGQEMKVKIIGLDKDDERLIVSEKATQEKQIEKDLSQYKEGDKVKGTVTALTDFGAFVKFDENLEGLIHISELDWQIIDHPKQILKENDQVEVQILSIKNNQVALSLKALKKDPWQEIESKYQNGSIVEGEIVKLNPSGAFVKIAEGINGFVSQSDLDQKEEPVLNQSFNFEVVSLVPQNHKMILRFSNE